MRKSFHVAALVAVGAIALPAQAQPVLTLDEAIALAQAHSLPVATSQSKLKQAQQQIGQTYAGLYPQLSLSSSALSYRQIDANAISNFGSFGGAGGAAGGLGGGLGGFGGANLGSFSGGGGAFNMVTNSLTLTQVLFDGFQTADALRIADATVKMDQIDEANQRRKAAYDLSNAYFQVLRTQSLREVASKAVTQAQAHVEAAEIRERAGTGTRFDVLQAQAQLANVEGQLRSATNNVELARLNLGVVMGEPLGNRTPSPVAVLPSAHLDLEQDLTPALESRPEIQTLVVKQRIDLANIDLKRKTNLPKAQAQAQYSQQGIGTGRSFMVMAGVSWNLIDWGKADSTVVAAEEDARQTQLNLELARRSGAVDIQSAVLSRQDAHDRVAIAQKGLQVSQESFRMAEVRYNAGVGTGYEVIDAQTALVQAQSNYVQATYDLQTAEIRLAQALGVDLQQVLAQKRS
jgi:outer membrane protein TolC